MFRRVLEACKKYHGKACPHCGCYNGAMRKATGMPL